jgi:hypothetical protein
LEALTCKVRLVGMKLIVEGFKAKVVVDIDGSCETLVVRTP